MYKLHSSWEKPRPRGFFRGLLLFLFLTNLWLETISLNETPNLTMDHIDFESAEFEAGLKLALPCMHVETFGEPTFFLAGPIRGGGDWQAKAIRTLYNMVPNAYIFCPCRYGEDHYLRKQSVLMRLPITDHGILRTGTFPNQTMWERRYFNEAYRDGSIIFWLPEESKVNPRRDGNPYARDTYGELGEWRTTLFYEANRLALGGRLSPNLVVGAEPGFPGLKQIQANFEAMLPGFVFHKTLEATIDAAIMKLAKL